MYKHWKKIALAIAAFFWNGCSDNSSSSDVTIACSFKGGVCPEYGVDFYYCENPEDYQSPDMDKNVLSLLMTHAPIITNVKMGPLV